MNITLPRVVVELDPPQHRALKVKAALIGSSVSDLVRNALTDAGLFKDASPLEKTVSKERVNV